MPEAARTIAGLLDADLAEVAAATDANATLLFALP